MHAIGGYFGFENAGKAGNHYHNTPYRLDCGRSALDIIIGMIKPRKVYVPFYTCNALLEPLIKNEIQYSFYRINEELEMIDKLQPAKNEFIIYINFFGLKNSYCKQLIKKYSQQVILDNTMAFFFRHSSPYWGFNSSRKFFGVVDGSYLQSPVLIREKLLPKTINPHLTTDFLFLRNENLVEKGYQFFTQNEMYFGKEIFGMSCFSENVLSKLSYHEIIKRRNDNFSFLHAHLKGSNTFLSPSLYDGAMVYPYLPKKKLHHQKFWNNQVFIPKLWQDCLERQGDYIWEKKLSEDLLPLPIDHRYNKNDLNRILKFTL